MRQTGEQQVSREHADEWAWRTDRTTLPRAVDVAIIGGGIVGVSAGYFLARRGVSVLVCEKGRLAGEQSGRNWGWVRQQGRSPIELPLMMRSLRIWQQFSQELGEDLGFRQCGSLYLADNSRDLEALGEWLPTAREAGLDTRHLTAPELERVLTCAPGRWAGALHTPSDGRAEPSRAVRSIARAAARAGAHIVSQCAVRGIEFAAGAVKSIVTEHGSVIAPIVVCAAGAWTRLFCGSINVDVPQLCVRGTVARLAPAPRVLDGEAWSPHVAIRRRCDGGYTVAHGSALHHSIVPATFRLARKFLRAFLQEHGAVRLRFGREFWRALGTPRRWALDGPSPFERERVLDPPPDARVLSEVRVALERWFPELGPIRFAETWGGMIESSPDVLPILSRVESLPGLIVATGFSGHGFGIGPGAGELIAELTTGRAETATLAPFRLSRFFDGSPIRPGPTL